MFSRSRSGFAAAFGVAALLVTAGCGGRSGEPVKEVKGATVKGRLLQNGQPVKHLKDETIHVTFSSGMDGQGGVSSAAEVNKDDGTFEIKGPTGQGIPAGKYRVSVASEIYGSTGENRFEGTFATDATPLQAEVGPEEGQHFEVDIGRRTVNKK